MKPFSFFFRVVAPTFFSSLIFAVATVAQAPDFSQRPLQPLQRTYQAPKNLKVLSKDLTGQQVHDIMKQWERTLGVRCDSCHAEATETIPPDDDSQLNFADDSKPMKAVARTMYKMTEDINQNYLAVIDNSGIPITCGTCHRGHVSPEPFVVPLNDGPPEPKAAPSTGEKKSSQ